MLEDLLVFDESTKELQTQLEELTRFSFKSKLIGRFPQEFLDAVGEWCANAIPRALSILASELDNVAAKPRIPSAKQLNALRRARKDSSFLDKKGTITFRRVGEKLALAAEDRGGRTPDYRRQLDRAVNRIRDSQITARIHNRDPELRALFDEYSNELANETPSLAAVSLWMIGLEIDGRVRSAKGSSAEWEALDANVVLYLSTFLTAHSLYLQSFPEIEQVSQDLARSTAIYQSLNEAARSAPWSLLTELSKNADVFEARTTDVLRKAADATDRPSAEHTQGLVAIGLGLLRGALRAMGALALERLLEIPESEADDAASIAEKLLSDKSLESYIVGFVRDHSGTLSRIAFEAPIYFHWLKPFLQMLGLS